MMRLWFGTYAQPPRLGSSAIVSAAVHGALIVGAVAATLGAPQSLALRLASHVVYVPPPDRYLARNVPTETVHFVALVPGGIVHLTLPKPKPVVLSLPEAPTAGLSGEASPASPKLPETTPQWNADSVASVLEVDSAVERDPASAAPAYPPSLLAKHIEGAVATRYIVDTTGFAEVASLDIVSATDTAFARAVRDALPHMRFHPAILHNHKVRQLVEQTFLFKIVRPAPDTAVIRKPAIL
jgi:Gram-negative bacterial TonB protein C-terminal